MYSLCTFGDIQNDICVACLLRIQSVGSLLPTLQIPSRRAKLYQSEKCAYGNDHVKMANAMRKHHAYPQICPFVL